MDIYFDSLFDDLLIELSDQQRIFSDYVDVACFASLLGLDNDNVNISNKGKVAPDRIFRSHQMHGLIYLVGIYKTQSLECLRDENESWGYFQKSVNAGMHVLSSWFTEHPTKSKNEVILMHMLEEASNIKKLQRKLDYVVGDLLS